MANQEKFLKAKRFATDFTLDDTAKQVLVKPATTTQQGKVQLATVTETSAGTSSAKAVTPAGLKAVLDAFSGGKSIVGVKSFDTVNENLILEMSDGSELPLAMTSMIEYILDEGGSDQTLLGYGGLDVEEISATILLNVGPRGTVLIPGAPLPTSVTQVRVPMDDFLDFLQDRTSNDFAGIVKLAAASGADNPSDTSNVVTPIGVYQSIQRSIFKQNEIAALVPNGLGEVYPDMRVNRNFTMTLEVEEAFLGAPTDFIVGRSGSILVVQDSVGGSIMSFASVYEAAGGISNLPDLTPTPGAVDRIDYLVVSDTSIHIQIALDIRRGASEPPQEM